MPNPPANPNQRPVSGAGNTALQTGQYSPKDLNPDLAAAAMAEALVKSLGAPTIISKVFAVRRGMFKSLNHSEYGVFDDNKWQVSPPSRTGLDTSLRCAIYDYVAQDSVNVDGKYFVQVWAYLMKPKYVIQGFQGLQPEEEKQSLLGRLMGKITGADKQPQGVQNGR